MSDLQKPAVGIVGSRDLPAIMKDLGVDVIDRSDFHESVKAIGAALTKHGPFPVVAKDGRVPGLKAWVERITVKYQTQVIVLRDPDNPIMSSDVVSFLDLPTTVNDILAVCGLPPVHGGADPYTGGLETSAGRHTTNGYRQDITMDVAPAPAPQKRQAIAQPSRAEQPAPGYSAPTIEAEPQTVPESRPAPSQYRPAEPSETFDDPSPEPSQEQQWDMSWSRSWDTPEASDDAEVTVPAGGSVEQPWDTPVEQPGTPSWDTPVEQPGTPSWDTPEQSWDTPVEQPGTPSWNRQGYQFDAPNDRIEQAPSWDAPVPVQNAQPEPQHWDAPSPMRHAPQQAQQWDAPAPVQHAQPERPQWDAPQPDQHAGWQPPAGDAFPSRRETVDTWDAPQSATDIQEGWSTPRQSPAGWDQPTTPERSAPQGWGSSPAPARRAEWDSSPVPGGMLDIADEFDRQASTRHQGTGRNMLGLGGLIITFSGKGGVGKTTASINIARKAAAAGLKTILIDGNAGQGDLVMYLRLNGKNLPTIYDAAVTGEPARAVLSPAEINRYRGENLDPVEFGFVAAPPPDISNPEVVTNSVYASVIELCRRKADLVVLDTQIIETRDASGVIGTVIIPALVGDAWGVGVADLTTTGVNNLNNRLVRMVREQVPPDRLMSVMNMVELDELAVAETTANRMAEHATFMGSIPLDRSIKEGMRTGRVDTGNEALDVIAARVLHRVTGNDEFERLAGSTPSTHQGEPRQGIMSKLLGMVGVKR